MPSEGDTTNSAAALLSFDVARQAKQGLKMDA
jgi:hypothetical protein